MVLVFSNFIGKMIVFEQRFHSGKSPIRRSTSWGATEVSDAGLTDLAKAVGQISHLDWLHLDLTETKVGDADYCGINSELFPLPEWYIAVIDNKNAENKNAEAKNDFL